MKTASAENLTKKEGAIKIMILASFYRGDHVSRMNPYHQLSKVASSWNSILFKELKKLDLELHIVQFYPVFRPSIFREGNVNYYYLPRVPKIDSFTSIIKKIRIRKLAKEIKPDVIHGIGSEHGNVYPALQDGIPSIITIHGYMKKIIKLKGNKDILKSLFMVREEDKAIKSSTRIIAINGYMKEQFIGSGCSEDKISIVPNALNSNFLVGCLDEERDIDILMVGTIYALKNQHRALEIIKELKSEFGKTPKMVIAGNPTGESKEYYDSIIKYKNRNKLSNVNLIGAVEQDKLKELYCKSKILLHISDFEADPTVIAEALACGVLPIVNPVAGLAYRVKDNENGYYIDIHNIHNAALALNNILDDFNKAQELVTKGKQDVLAERSPEKIAVNTAGLYYRVIDEYDG